VGTAGIWTRFFETPVADWLDLVRAERAHHEDWQEAVKRGGFPAVALETHDEQQRSLWFDGYIATYLERDLRDLQAVSNLQGFRVLMQAAALRIVNLLNHAELARRLISSSSANASCLLLKLRLEAHPGHATWHTSRPSALNTRRRAAVWFFMVVMKAIGLARTYWQCRGGA
jgi:hypothetical protein